MTIVFTVATPFAIVAACDSAVREDSDGDASYSTGRKDYGVAGVGVVTTWGARDGNGIGPFIRDLSESQKVRNVTELADSVRGFLEDHFRPRERGSPDVGFHVAGFEQEAPLVYHVFWNAPRAGTSDQGVYEIQQHRPGPGIFMLYNGRDDLAGAVVSSLIHEIDTGQRTPFDLSRSVGLVALAHLVLRFASELTFDVGPPFLANIIAPDNRSVRAHLPDWQPLTEPSSMRMLDMTAQIRSLVHAIKLDSPAV